MSGPVTPFDDEVRANVAALASRHDLWPKTLDWMLDVGRQNYTYNFSWLGRPIIQYPQDMVALQEIVWRVRPDVIIETGIAHGGSLVFSASMLALLDITDHKQGDRRVRENERPRRVIGIDIDIRAHNRAAIAQHPLADRIAMIQGSSIDADTVAEVRQHVRSDDVVLVCLDSNHTRDHVLAELRAYSPWVSNGSYVIVYDTVVEYMPPEFCVGRPWGPGNSPLTAVREFLAESSDFQVDSSYDHKLQVTVARGGYLRRVRGNDHHIHS